MGVVVEKDLKRWMAERKVAMVTEILQGKTSVSEASRAHDLSPSEIEEWWMKAVTGLGFTTNAGLIKPSA